MNYFNLTEDVTYLARRGCSDEVADLHKEGLWDNSVASVDQAERVSARSPRLVAPVDRYFRPLSSASRYQVTRKMPWLPTTRISAWWGWEVRRDPAEEVRLVLRRTRSASATLPSPSAWSFARDAPSPSSVLPGDCWSSVTIIVYRLFLRRSWQYVNISVPFLSFLVLYVASTTTSSACIVTFFSHVFIT